MSSRPAFEILSQHTLCSLCIELLVAKSQGSISSFFKNGIVRSLGSRWKWKGMWGQIFGSDRIKMTLYKRSQRGDFCTELSGGLVLEPLKLWLSSGR